uniref:Uncharacterized protein n=1 Tax=Cannabis sativa TaxID=3483 RepID=A0A803QQ28_CANSA
MSLAGSLNPADPEKLFKKSFHKRNDSGELDVFEAASDSSSDLFELQNYDLGCYSSGLPVYETTNMDTIKRVWSVCLSLFFLLFWKYVMEDMMEYEKYH